MVGKEKPLNKVNQSVSLVVDTCDIIVKQEPNLLSPQSTSSDHSSLDIPVAAQNYSLCEEKAIIKYEDDSNTETTLANNEKPDRWVFFFFP